VNRTLGASWGHTFLEQLVKSTILTDVAPLCEVIMDVMNKEQAKIAEEAGACAVMALERTLACNSFKISLQSCSMQNEAI